jgi:hypothetical protein
MGLFIGQSKEFSELLADLAEDANEARMLVVVQDCLRRREKSDAALSFGLLQDCRTSPLECPPSVIAHSRKLLFSVASLEEDVLVSRQAKRRGIQGSVQRQAVHVKGGRIIRAPMLGLHPV